MINLNRKFFIAAAFWLLLFIMFFQMANYFQSLEFALITATYNIVTLTIMYYITVRFLFPRFYKKGKVYFFISLAFIIVLGIVFCFIDIQLLDRFSRSDHEKPPQIFHYTRFIMAMAFTFFVATSISLIEQASKMLAKEKMLTEDKLETELKLLKAQINPHFIFNALNNIYSLSYMKSKNAPDSILQLSEMLRYVFYDCSKDRVPLRSELKYIENFNAFQQMKSDFTQNISLEEKINGENIEIAPMLFIPFLENAFKYSRIEEHEEAYVSINIEAKGKKLHFIIENSLPDDSKPESGSGMGIQNVKQRLAIIYPDQYKLDIQDTNYYYRVELQIEV